MSEKNIETLLQEAKELRDEIMSYIEQIGAVQRTGVSNEEYSIATHGADVIKKEIEKRKMEKIDLFSMGPLYLKPAFYLDSFTPFVKVILLLDINQINNKNYRFEIFDNSNDPTNNHIKSFTVDYLGQGSGLKFNLALSDIDNKMTDLLAFQLMALSAKFIIPWFEIEYGWASNKKVTIGKRNAKFSKKIYCVLGGEDGDNGFSVSTNLSGITDLTLSGRDDSTPPPPADQSPMTILGPCPGLNLTSYYICSVIENLLSNGIGVKGDYQNNIKKFIIELYLFFYKVHSMTIDIITFKKLLVNAFIYFRAIGSVNNDYFPFSEKNKKVEPDLNDSIEKRIQSDYSISILTSCIKNVIKVAEDTNVSKCISSKKIISDANLINNFKMNQIDNMLKIKRSYDAGFIGAGSNVIIAQMFYNFFESFYIFASEMMIHPFYVWNYCWESFDIHVQNNGKAKIIMLDDGLLGDNAIDALSNQNTDLGYWNTTLFDEEDYNKKQLGSVLPSCEIKLDITNPEHREKYMKMAFEFNISSGTSWSSLFNQIGNNIKVNYYINNKFEADQLNIEINDNDYKKTKNGSIMVKPMSINAQLQYVPGPQANETLGTFKKMLEYKKERINKLKNVNKSLIKKMTKNIEKQINVLNKI